MRAKIIYVDFKRKHRISFIHFLLNKVIKLITIRFNVKIPNSQIVNSYKISRTSK